MTSFPIPTLLVPIGDNRGTTSRFLHLTTDLDPHRFLDPNCDSGAVMSCMIIEAQQVTSLHIQFRRSCVHIATITVIAKHEISYYHTVLQLYLLVPTVIRFGCALLRLGWKIRSTLVLFSIHCSWRLSTFIRKLKGPKLWKGFAFPP
jgi:hypothetical protein